MNKNTLRALFDDSVAQVLDNVGFRLLAVLFLLLVLPTLLIGLREEHVRFLFYWEVPYDQLFGGTTREKLLTNLEIALFDFIADGFGILFCVASVSFFVPNLMQKGAADTLFSKPVSRVSLLVSRYLAGLIFVALLATLLVGGVYLGLLVVSDYNNPGILWSIGTLTYGFAVFHAISVVVGVFTRSAIAALLVTFVFMPINCGVHTGWHIKDFVAASDELTARRPAGQQEKQENEDATPAPERSGAFSGLASAAAIALDVAHYVLPKTTETTMIAQDLRKRVESVDHEFVDRDSSLALVEGPRGFTRESRSSLTHDEGLLWVAPHTGGGEARWTLKREDYDGSESRTARVKALKKRLAEDPNVSAIDSDRAAIGGRTSDRVEWREKRGAETRLRRNWIFQSDKYLFTLDYDAELDWAAAAEHETSAGAFIASFSFTDSGGLGQSAIEAEYAKRYGWGGELKYNFWFSIASTLAFIAVVLALGCWKLSRIDF